jgi:hypothetical protein
MMESFSCALPATMNVRKIFLSLESVFSRQPLAGKGREPVFLFAPLFAV